MANTWQQIDLPNPENLYEHATRLERDFGNVVLYLERSGAEFLSKSLLLKLHDSYAQLVGKITQQPTGHALSGKSEGSGAQSTLHPGREVQAVFQMKVHDEDNEAESKRDCDEGNFSEENTEGEESLDDEDGENQDGEFMMRGAMPVGEARRARFPCSPAYQKSSSSGRLLNYGLIDVNAFSAPTDIFRDVYMVEMSAVEYANMNLSDEKAMFRVAQVLTQDNFNTQSCWHRPSDILDVRWKKQNPGSVSNLGICFATIKQATKALSSGLLWNGKSHFCSPLLQHKVVRCLKCLQYGHQTRYCSSPQRCKRCGSDQHDKGCDRSTVMKCPACGGPHCFINSKCPQLLVEMGKEGLWPSKVKIDKGPSPPLTAEGKHKAQGMDESRSQHLSADTVRLPTSLSGSTGISTLIGSTPNPSDTRAILEHLDELKTLVLARNPVQRLASKSRSSKRKAKEHRGRGDPLATAPKRVKMEEKVHIKQEV